MKNIPFKVFLISFICLLPFFQACKRATNSQSTPPHEQEEVENESITKFTEKVDVQVPDFSAFLTHPAYKDAVNEISKICESPSQPINNIPGGFTFTVPQRKAESILKTHHKAFLEKGVFLFRRQSNYNIQNEPDVLAVLPTTNKYELIAVIETSGPNHDLETGHIIAWLQKLEKDQPFLLTGVSEDFLEGYFTTPIQDPKGLAVEMYRFCPDIVDQGIGSVEELAEELRNKRQLYLWWD